MATIVVNIKTGAKFDVYIGRPSEWGNPFAIGRDGTREEVIFLYERWLRTQPQLVHSASTELKGKALGCYCKPAACHGDVLVKVAEGRLCGCPEQYKEDPAVRSSCPACLGTGLIPNGYWTR